MLRVLLGPLQPKAIDVESSSGLSVEERVTLNGITKSLQVARREEVMESCASKGSDWKTMRTSNSTYWVAIPFSASDLFKYLFVARGMIEQCLQPRARCALLLRYIESNCGANISHLPTRWLPPGNIRMTYYAFAQLNPRVSCLAQMGLDNSMLSYMTFYKRFKSHWANVLKFLPASTHSICDECTDAKNGFKSARDASLKRGWLSVRFP